MKLDMDAVAESHKHYGWGDGDNLKAHQTAVFVMCGGGFLGESAAKQPADFYIDPRVGTLPFPKRKILQAVKCLAVLATAAGHNPHNLPDFPRFHNCGIF